MASNYPRTLVQIMHFLLPLCIYSGRKKKKEKVFPPRLIESSLHPILSTGNVSEMLLLQIYLAAQPQI